MNPLCSGVSVICRCVGEISPKEKPDGAASVHRLSLLRLLPLDLLNGRKHAFPHPLPVQAALLKHGVGALGGFQGGVLAVLAD